MQIFGSGLIHILQWTLLSVFLTFSNPFIVYLLDSITSKQVITLGKDRLKSKIKSLVFSQNAFEKLELHDRCTDVGILYALTDDKVIFI